MTELRAERDDGATDVEAGAATTVVEQSLDGADSAGRLRSQPSQPLVPSTSVVATMFAEEAERTAAFGRTVFFIILVALPWLPLLGSAPWLTALMVAMLFGVEAVALWVWRRAEQHFSTRMFRIFAVACVVCSVITPYYVGVFSPAALVVTLGIGFFGLGADRLWAVMAPVLATTANVLLTGLITFGVIEDRGLIRGTDASLAVKVWLLLMVPVIYATTLLLARASRRATVEAFERVNRATQLAQLREAQAQEANQNLDRAIRAGVGKTGRYSGRSVGRYALAEVIGRGAMGEVYAATEAGTGRPAAVKLLHAATLERSDLVLRFTRETEITSRLHVPNVVAVYDLGKTAEGVPYLAMELLDGQDLASRLRERRLTLEETKQLVLETARGLEAAHDAGVVHRDLKPQNLFHHKSSEGPVWKVLDFGVSKLQSGTGTLTQNDVVGTPAYMSPEQARGQDVDRRSDVFSFGAVAYRALTGRPAFAGPDMPQIVFDVVFKSPTRPREVAPHLPADIELVLAIALAKEREDRFASAAELARAFEAASRAGLDPALRARAVRLIRAYPWGALFERSREDPRASKP